MSCIIITNDSTVSAGTRRPLPVHSGAAEEAFTATVSAPQSSQHYSLVLSRIDNELISAFRDIPQVAALYAELDNDGLLMVFVVVAEHDDSVYEQVMIAEEKVRSRVSTDFELRVRAHQGRTSTKAVPLRTLPLFLK